MKVTLKKTNSTEGVGKKLFGIIWVQVNMPENSYVNYWLANDEEHLQKQIRAKLEEAFNNGTWCAQDDLGDESFEKQFETDWNYHIKPFEIGNISK